MSYKIKVLIPNYKCVNSRDGEKPYHVYSIHVNIFTNGISRIYFVERRYSDFLQLHNELRRYYETPEFPPKKVRNTRVKVLESRRIMLEQYLQIMTDSVPMPREISNFLNINIWEKDMMAQSWRDDRSSIYSSISSDWETNEKSICNPAAAFFEDPFIDSDSSSNISDSITRGVLDALYH